MENFGQNVPGVFPLVVAGSYNSTDSLERPEQDLYTLSPNGRPGPGQQFLSYDGAEVNSRGVFIIKFTYEGGALFRFE